MASRRKTHFVGAAGDKHTACGVQSIYSDFSDDRAIVNCSACLEKLDAQAGGPACPTCKGKGGTRSRECGCTGTCFHGPQWFPCEDCKGTGKLPEGVTVQGDEPVAMKKGDTVIHRASPCPRCTRQLDASTAIQNGVGPVPGDVTICAHCEAVLVYGEALALRQQTESEWRGMDSASQDQVLRALGMVRMMKRRSKAGAA